MLEALVTIGVIIVANILYNLHYEHQLEERSRRHAERCQRSLERLR